MSVDPYIGRAERRPAIGPAAAGRGIGRVVQSRNPKFAEGDLVRHGPASRSGSSQRRGVQVLKRDPALPLTVYMPPSAAPAHRLRRCSRRALKDGEQVLSPTGLAVGSVAAR